MSQIDLNNNLHCVINLLLVNWHSYYLPQRDKQLGGSPQVTTRDHKIDGERTLMGNHRVVDIKCFPVRFPISLSASQLDSQYLH